MNARYKVVEIFDSIQGEGIQIGTPMTFVRLAGCNLRCKWCDTKYAWEGGEELSATDIAVRANQNYVCITGGEPLLQDLTELVETLKWSKWITVETNGTIFPSDDVLWTVDLWTVSPKLGSSGMQPRPDVVDLFVKSRVYMQLKFVIQDEEDYKAVKKLLRMLDEAVYEVPIVLQPEGSIIRDHNDLPAYLAKLSDLAKIVTFDDFWRDFDEVRVLPQLHRIVWPEINRGR